MTDNPNLNGVMAWGSDPETMTAEERAIYDKLKQYAVDPNAYYAAFYAGEWIPSLALVCLRSDGKIYRQGAFDYGVSQHSAKRGEVVIVKRIDSWRN